MTLPARSAGSGGWTDDDVATLTKLWREGDLSAAMIARRLGVTRNAVLGKVHRLGLSKPRTVRPPGAPRAPRPARPRPLFSPPTTQPPTAKPSPAPAFEVGPGLAPRLEDLPRRACHWPLGDPKAPDFAFCGRRADAGPYCPGHSGMAYRGRGVDVAELARLLRS